MLVEERVGDLETPERDEAPGEEGRFRVGGFLDDEVDELDRNDLGE